MTLTPALLPQQPQGTTAMNAIAIIACIYLPVLACYACHDYRR